jgi:hypothetical protein
MSHAPRCRLPASTLSKPGPRLVPTSVDSFRQGPVRLRRRGCPDKSTGPPQPTRATTDTGDVPRGWMRRGSCNPAGACDRGDRVKAPARSAASRVIPRSGSGDPSQPAGPACLPAPCARSCPTRRRHSRPPRLRIASGHRRHTAQPPPDPSSRASGRGGAELSVPERGRRAPPTSSCVGVNLRAVKRLSRNGLRRHPCA